MSICTYYWSCTPIAAQLWFASWSSEAILLS